MAVIALRDATKTYGAGAAEVHALRGVSLSIHEGEYVAIMGASGSGKSTLMHILGCLDVPTTGSYILRDQDVRSLDDRRLAEVRNHMIGFVFQSFNLLPRTSALANVEMPLTYARVPRAQRRARAVAALEAVGLADRMAHLPSELSGGQQQRAAVARAIVTDPAIVLGDEPTGNLDSVATSEVLGVFDDLNAQGRTVVLITHEDDVASRAGRVIRLRDGAVAEDETRNRAPKSAASTRRLRSHEVAR